MRCERRSGAAVWPIVGQKQRKIRQLMTNRTTKMLPGMNEIGHRPPMGCRGQGHGLDLARESRKMGGTSIVGEAHV